MDPPQRRPVGSNRLKDLVRRAKTRGAIRVDSSPRSAPRGTTPMHKDPSPASAAAAGSGGGSGGGGGGGGGGSSRAELMDRGQAPDGLSPGGIARPPSSSSMGSVTAAPVPDSMHGLAPGVVPVHSAKTPVGASPPAAPIHHLQTVGDTTSSHSRRPFFPDSDNEDDSPLSPADMGSPQGAGAAAAARAIPSPPSSNAGHEDITDAASVEDNSGGKEGSRFQAPAVPPLALTGGASRALPVTRLSASMSGDADLGSGSESDAEAGIGSESKDPVSIVRRRNRRKGPRGFPALSSVARAAALGASFSSEAAKGPPPDAGEIAHGVSFNEAGNSVRELPATTTVDVGAAARTLRAVQRVTREVAGTLDEASAVARRVAREARRHETAARRAVHETRVIDPVTRVPLRASAVLGRGGAGTGPMAYLAYYDADDSDDGYDNGEAAAEERERGERGLVEQPSVASEVVANDLENTVDSVLRGMEVTAARRSAAIRRRLAEAEMRQQHASDLLEAVVERNMELGRKTRVFQGYDDLNLPEDDTKMARDLRADVRQLRERLEALGARVAASAFSERRSHPWDASMSLQSFHQPVVAYGDADSALRERGKLLSQWRDQLNAWLAGAIASVGVYLSHEERHGLARCDLARGVFSEASRWDPEAKVGSNDPASVTDVQLSNEAEAARQVDDARLRAVTLAIVAVIQRRATGSRDDAGTSHAHAISDTWVIRHIIALEAAIRDANEVVRLISDYFRGRGWFHPKARVLHADEMERMATRPNEDALPTGEDEEDMGASPVAPVRPTSALSLAAIVRMRIATRAMRRAAAARILAKEGGADPDGAAADGGAAAAAAAGAAAGSGDGAERARKKKKDKKKKRKHGRKGRKGRGDDDDDEDKPPVPTGELRWNPGFAVYPTVRVGITANEDTFHPACTGLVGLRSPMGSVGALPAVRPGEKENLLTHRRSRLVERLVIAERRVRLTCMRVSLMRLAESLGIAESLSCDISAVATAETATATAAEADGVGEGADATAPTEALDGGLAAEAGGDSAPSPPSGDASGASRSEAFRGSRTDVMAAWETAAATLLESISIEEPPARFVPSIDELLKSSDSAIAENTTDTALIAFLRRTDEFDTGLCAQPWLSLEDEEAVRVIAVERRVGMELPYKEVTEADLAGVARTRRGSGAGLLPGEAMAPASPLPAESVVTESLSQFPPALTADDVTQATYGLRIDPEELEGAPPKTLFRSADASIPVMDEAEESGAAVTPVVDAGIATAGAAAGDGSGDSPVTIDTSEIIDPYAQIVRDAAPIAALYDLQNRRLRRSGRSFALMELEARRMMVQALMMWGGGHLIAVSSRLVRGWDAQRTRGRSYTDVGSLILLLRPTMAGMSLAAIATGFRVQIVHNHLKAGERTGVPDAERDTLENASSLCGDEPGAVLTKDEERRDYTSGIPETLPPTQKYLYWDVLYASPFAAYSSMREYSALWRRFRVRDRRSGDTVWKKEYALDPLPSQRNLGDADGAMFQRRLESEPESAVKDVLEHVEEEEDGLLSKAEEQVFGPAARRELLRWLLLRLPWPTRHTPAAIAAADSAGDDGTCVSLATRDSVMKDRSGVGVLLAPDMTRAFPTTFEYLHDVEVLDQMQDLATERIDNDVRAFLPTSTFPADAERVIHASATYFGERTGRLISVAVNNARAFTVLCIITLVLRVVIGEPLRATVVKDWMAEIAQGYLDAGAPDVNSSLMPTFFIQAVYAVLILFGFTVYQESLSLRTWSFESLLLGRSARGGNESDIRTAAKLDSVEYQARRRAFEDKRPTYQFRNAAHDYAAAHPIVENEPDVEAALEGGNAVVVEHEPTWDHKSFVEDSVHRQSLYSTTYRLLDYTAVCSTFVLQALALYGVYKFSQFVEGVSGGDPSNPGIWTAVIMPIGVPLSAVILHAIYAKMIKPRILPLVFPSLLASQSATIAADPYLAPVKPHSVAGSASTFAHASFTSLSHTYTPEDEMHDAYSFLLCLLGLYLGPAFYIALLAERIHDARMCPERDCYTQAGVQALVAQAFFLVSALLSHAVSMRWSQPSGGVRGSSRSLWRRSPLLRVCPNLDPARSSLCIPVRVLGTYLGGFLCSGKKRFSTVSIAGTIPWASVFVRWTADHSNVQRAAFRLRPATRALTMEAADDAEFIACYSPASKGLRAQAWGSARHKPLLPIGAKSEHSWIRPLEATREAADMTGPHGAACNAPSRVLALIKLIRDRSMGDRAALARLQNQIVRTMVRYHQSVGASAMEEAALLQTLMPAKPRRGLMFAGHDAQRDEAWWIAMQCVAPSRLLVDRILRAARDAGGGSGRASVVSPRSPRLLPVGSAAAAAAAAGNNAGAGVDTPVANPLRTRKRRSLRVNTTAAEVAETTKLLNHAAAAASLGEEAHRAEAKLDAAVAEVTTHQREYSRLPTRDHLKDLPRLLRLNLHDDMHAMAIQAFLFGSAVLLCALPFPYIPVMGFAYTFVEARLLTTRRVFGSKVEYPRGYRMDHFTHILRFLTGLAFVTNIAVVVFTRLLNWDVISDVYPAILIMVIGPPLLFLIQRGLVRLVGHSECHACFCGRRTTLDMFRLAERPYERKVDEMFGAVQRLRLHEQDGAKS